MGERIDLHPAVQMCENPVFLSSEHFMDPAAARSAGDTVVKLRDHWNSNILSVKGLPHMTLGVRYSGIIYGGQMVKMFQPDEHSDLLWREFGTVYENLAVALS